MMRPLYLHHYPESPFSEKIRAILGYLGLEWHSVKIPVVMPKPLLMPLSGGYRKTPVLQIGANVYCDTKIIASALARYAGDRSLFAGGFNVHRVADWADTHLFRVAVVLNFRPEAISLVLDNGKLANVPIEEFIKDRSELTGGVSLLSFSTAAAEGYLLHYLSELEASLSDQFLFGSKPTIADFSVYHCLWFLKYSPANAAWIESRPKIMAWFSRMQAFGQSKSIESSGEAALASARSHEPELPERIALDVKVKLGDTVKITPIDYGCVPVSGELLCADAEQFALLRRTDATGKLVNHFPRAGFDIQA